jgi:hypothetical protein
VKYLPLYSSLQLSLLLSNSSNLDKWSISKLINTILNALEYIYVYMCVCVCM